MFNFKIFELWQDFVRAAAVAVAVVVVSVAHASHEVDLDFDMKCLTPVTIRNPKTSFYSPEPYISVPCGKCPACLMNKKRSLSHRLYETSKVACTSYFVTFTYATQYLKFDTYTGYPVLDKRDMQLFFKRLRIEFPHAKIKYFCVSEYGDLGLRPHYHAIIFGIPITETPVFNGKRYFYPAVKAKLDEIWQLGFTDVGSFSPASCYYVAKYTFKGLLDPDMHPYANEYWHLCSKGLGIEFVQKRGDFFRDNLLTSTTWNGYPLPLCRYYQNKIFYNNENEQLNRNFHIRLYFKNKDNRNTSVLDTIERKFRADDGQQRDGALLFSQYLDQCKRNLRRTARKP